MKSKEDELLVHILDSIGKIASLHDYEDLLYELAKLGRDLVVAERCTVWIYDKKINKLFTKVAQDINHIVMDADIGLVGYAIQNNEALIINDAQNDSRFNSRIDALTGYKTNTMIVIPMKNKNNKIIGAIQVINKKENKHFSQDDLKNLSLVSWYAAESLTSIFMREEVNKTQKELINIIGLTAENRCVEMGQHVRRVAEYSYLLGRLYGLDQTECEILRDASPLHDIGKIGIEDAIFKKPGKLTPEERTIMCKHTTIGYDILKHSELTLIKAASTIAHEHHEKYDGSGYPRALKGEEIHIYGRITALADVFDALGSKRIYKEAWSNERVVELLEEERGKYFDPVLVDVFLENHHAFLEIKERFRDVA